MPHKLQNHDSNIITEDDPQGGVDHVDAHQSMLMMAGRYVNKGYVSHTHANFGAILKTIDWRKIEKDPDTDDVNDAREDHAKNNTDD